MASFPDAWEECALITIDRYDASSPITLQANALTETIDIAQGDYPGESIPNIAGGRVWKQSPEEDGEITLEMYPTSLTIDTNTTPDTYQGVFQFFAGGTIDTTTPTQPIATTTTFSAGVSRVRDRFRVTIMWTDDTAQTSATATTTATDKTALRFSAMGCRMTSHKAEFTDGILKVTATFKYPAMNKDGTVRMWKWESTNDTDTSPIGALPAYDDDDAWS